MYVLVLELNPHRVPEETLSIAEFSMFIIRGVLFPNSPSLT
jgi:hypothetical protein